MSGNHDNGNDSLVFLAHRANRAMVNALNKSFVAAGLDLTVEQWRVLNRLWQRDGLTQTALCGRLMQEKTGVSRLVDGLVARSLVVRSEAKGDKRRRHVFLTLEGKRLRQRCQAEAQAVLDRALAGVEPAAEAVCRRVLLAVVANLAGRDGEGE